MRRAVKLVVVAVLLVGAAGLVLAGSAPQATENPTTAVREPLGSYFQIRGIIAPGSVVRGADNGSFLLTDGTTSVLVRAETALPSNASAGPLDSRVVLVAGTLESAGGRLVFDAKSIQVGCPSKYEPA
jgi:cytochrome c-type biogenesis protein CcmE